MVDELDRGVILVGPPAKARYDARNLDLPCCDDRGSDGRSTIRTIGTCGSTRTGPTLISIQIWSNPASAENAFRDGLVTWENDPDPHEAPVVY